MILRIGICDDVQMNIACLTEHIRHYMASYNVEFEIESFTSGEKLLQAQKERPFHILLLDIEMPQMDGHHLTKLIKEDRTLSKIPVILFSSLISEEMRIKGKQLGADEQLSKPEIGHLVAVMDHLLHQAAENKA